MCIRDRSCPLLLWGIEIVTVASGEQAHLPDSCTQFPWTLGYVVGIHHSQVITVEKVIVNSTNSEFQTSLTKNM